MDAADLPPQLQWEDAVWWLYQRICTQWRRGSDGLAVALDYNPAIALMQHLGWPIDLGLELLQVVELEMLVRKEAPAPATA